jgi:hypothetical protein
MRDMITPLAIQRPLVAPRSAPALQATLPSNALADAISRMQADASFQQAWQADPWMALACYDLIQQPTA